MSNDAVIPQQSDALARPSLSPAGRYALIALGWTSVAIGLVGIVIPGLPTTVFVLIAAWAFSRSSPRFEHWLLNHRRFGPSIAAWRARGAIPLQAKILAVVTMAASFAAIVLYAGAGREILLAIGLAMSTAAAFVVTRPNA